MKNLLYAFLSLSLFLAACGTATPVIPTATETATVTIPTVTPIPYETPSETPTPQPTSTPSYPPEGYGPSNFPTDVDPLTGLKVADPALLDRRPMLIKVSNIPRNNRPQWGLSLSDIVFEYYTEEGNTRFAAIFLGNNADIVGPIRSGRFIDGQLVRGYKAMFAFGSAYISEMERFLKSDFVNRLVIEGYSTPLTRFDPNGVNFLVANTVTLSAYATSKGINGRQNLDGMSFNLASPAGGQPVPQIFVRYSGVIYNRWDYDPATGRYLRFADAVNDYNNVKEEYTQLIDRLTNQPIAFDNLVVIYVAHELYSRGIYDIQLNGTGDGYAFRDGQAYQVKWQRNSTDVVSLTNLDGTPYAFKPGTTWFEVVGVNSSVEPVSQGWRFTHQMP
jgi:Protein of unknown function (DUF3048) N-terminal domain/Protein of unknown function (DUF3048) C-terminal domain